MAKKTAKRVSWTAENVRTLKSLAKKKTPAPKIAKALKAHRGCNEAKGVQPWYVARQSGLITNPMFQKKGPLFHRGPFAFKRRQSLPAVVVAGGIPVIVRIAATIAVGICTEGIQAPSPNPSPRAAPPYP